MIHLELKTDTPAEFLDLVFEHMRMCPVGSASIQHENDLVRIRIVLQNFRKECLERRHSKSRCVVTDADVYIAFVPKDVIDSIRDFILLAHAATRIPVFRKLNVS